MIWSPLFHGSENKRFTSRLANACINKLPQIHFKTEMSNENSKTSGLKKSLENSSVTQKVAVKCVAKGPPSTVVNGQDERSYARKLDWWKKSMKVSDKNLFDDHDPDPIEIRHMSLS